MNKETTFTPKAGDMVAWATNSNGGQAIQVGKFQGVIKTSPTGTFVSVISFGYLDVRGGKWHRRRVKKIMNPRPTVLRSASAEEIQAVGVDQ